MTETDAASRAFTHAEGIPEQAGTPISSTTRYLAGAAYVDEAYADIVIDELVGQSHRAVAPALGYDVVTIIRHCFRAQRLWLRQNAMLTVILLLGAWFFTAATVTLFVVSLAVHVLRSGGGRAHSGKQVSWKLIGGGTPPGALDLPPAHAGRRQPPGPVDPDLLAGLLRTRLTRPTPDRADS